VPLIRAPRLLTAVLLMTAVPVMALTGCGRPRTGDFAVSGTLRLINSGGAGNFTISDGTCVGAGPYAEISVGTLVTVSAGTDALADGTLTSATIASPTECDWTITVAHVAAGRIRYSLAVGTEPLKAFSEGDMRANPTITLGG
jgi:hypothetical protein